MSMFSDDMTPGEIGRALSGLNRKLDNIAAAVDKLTASVVEYKYQIADHEQRLSKLEKIVSGVVAAIILSFVGIVIEGVLGR